jgi:hypothetical protein
MTAQCNHTHGFYVKRTDSYLQFYTADGEADGTMDVSQRGGEVAYCAVCGKRLGKIVVSLSGKVTVTP